MWMKRSLAAWLNVGQQYLANKGEIIDRQQQGEMSS
jgi:hypothetical protein